jgi:hypothetical protein
MDQTLRTDEEIVSFLSGKITERIDVRFAESFDKEGKVIFVRIGMDCPIDGKPETYCLEIDNAALLRDKLTQALDLAQQSPIIKAS